MNGAIDRVLLCFVVVRERSFSPISARFTSLGNQSYDCPFPAEVTLTDLGEYPILIHYVSCYNHNKTTQNKPWAYFMEHIF